MESLIGRRAEYILRELEEADELGGFSDKTKTKVLNSLASLLIEVYTQENPGEELGALEVDFITNQLTDFFGGKNG